MITVALSVEMTLLVSILGEVLSENSAIQIHTDILI